MEFSSWLNQQMETIERMIEQTIEGISDEIQTALWKLLHEIGEEVLEEYSDWKKIVGSVLQKLQSLVTIVCNVLGFTSAEQLLPSDRNRDARRIGQGDSAVVHSTQGTLSERLDSASPTVAKQGEWKQVLVRLYAILVSLFSGMQEKIKEKNEPKW